MEQLFAIGVIEERKIVSIEVGRRAWSDLIKHRIFQKQIWKIERSVYFAGRESLYLHEQWRR